MSDNQNAIEILTKGTTYTFDVFDEADGDKRTGILNFNGVFLGQQQIGASTWVKLSRTVGEGKKTSTEVFALNLDKVKYISDTEQPKPPPAKKEKAEDEDEAE